MSDDDDDPVVDEIPVYLTQELADKLFIYQYPVHPVSSTYQSINVIKSQIKPELQEVILDIGLDTDSANYDKSHGEQIASSIDKDKTTQNKIFSSNLMDRVRLESTRSIIDNDSYAVGIMRGNQLVLSPIRGVVTLLPSFSHISQEEEKESEGEDEEEEQPKMVRVQFSRMETEKSKKAREASYNYYCQKSAEEPWYHTEYHGVDSTISKMERAKMTIGNVGGETEMDLTSTGYIDALLPRESEGDGSLPPDSLTSVNHLRQLPLPEQVKLVLFDVKVVNAQQLSCTLRTDIDRVVQCLQTCAVMVLGNWVLRSDLLYSTTHNGIPPQAMIRARDYILHEFHEGRVVERKSLSALVGLPQEELREMMSQVGVLRRNKRWHFRLSPDTNFLERFPEVVEQQNLLWEARAKGLLDSLDFNATLPKQRKRKESETLGATAANVSGKPRKSMSSDSECENAIGSGKSGKKPGRRTRRTGNDCITPVALAADIQIKQELPEGS
ncbi:RNA polymerase III subunit E [Rhodnius prolixus]